MSFPYVFENFPRSVTLQPTGKTGKILPQSVSGAAEAIFVFCFLRM
jgi:hypothetical protein